MLVTSKLSKNSILILLTLFSVVCCLSACDDAETTEMAGIMVSGETSSGEAMSGMNAGVITSGQMMAGATTSGELMAGESVAGEMPAEITPAGSIPAGETTSGEAVSGAMNAGEISMGNSPLPPTTPVESCEEFGAVACFANHECEADARCQNVGTPDFSVPCCVQGERGSLNLGEMCTEADGQLSCASSICIMLEGQTNGLCSDECTSDMDCPATMPRCIPIAFSGSDSMWCFPPERGE